MVDKDLECSICLQNLVHPVKLPCNHIFCFLCIKGCAFYRKRCPICRNRISSRFFVSPCILKKNELHDKLLSSTSGIPSASDDLVSTKETPILAKEPDVSESSLDQYTWFYEGFDGWWQYDDRTSVDIETAYNLNQSQCFVTIAGYIYIIDFKEMSQVRKDRSGRKRCIKRDLINCDKKGIAGIKLTFMTDQSNSKEISKLNSTMKGSKNLEETVDNELCSCPSQDQSISNQCDAICQRLTLTSLNEDCPNRSLSNSL